MWIGRLRRQSYLNVPAIISAAEGRRPGNPSRLRLSCRRTRISPNGRTVGFVFIGPRPETIRLMGDKITAIEAMQAGVPLSPARTARSTTTMNAHCGGSRGRSATR